MGQSSNPFPNENNGLIGYEQGHASRLSGVLHLPCSSPDHFANSETGLLSEPATGHARAQPCHAVCIPGPLGPTGFKPQHRKGGRGSFWGFGGQKEPLTKSTPNLYSYICSSASSHPINKIFPILLTIGIKGIGGIGWIFGIRGSGWTRFACLRI